MGLFDSTLANAAAPVAPATPVAPPQTVADLYTSVLGRAADTAGAQYWQQQFGDTLDANEIATFQNAAAPELVQNAYAGIGRADVGTDVSNIDQGGLDYWTGQLQSGALAPDQFQNAFQAAVQNDITAQPTSDYAKYVQDAQAAQGKSGIEGLYQAYLGRAPESQDVVNQWKSQFGDVIDPNEVALFRQATTPEIQQTGYFSTPAQTETKRFISSILADNSLSDWEKTTKIMDQAKQGNLSQAQLESLYKTDNPYAQTYKSGITDYINKALATDPTKTTFDEVGQIHQAASKYGLTADDIAKYTGMDKNQAQSYFNQYEQGLGTVMARLNDPKVDDLTKTQTALALASKYGATDAELAKASGGKYTEQSMKEYLDPVRNVPTNLQKLFDDPNATAKDITKFIAEAKADPRAAGIYGVALDKFANNPELYLRDAINGKADVSDSYEGFLTMAKSTPEMATKYAPQIKQIEQAKSIIDKHALNKDFGGEYKDFAMQMFLGLDQGTTKQAPKQLELTKPTTKTITEYGEAGERTDREVVVPGQAKGAGLQPIYESLGDDGTEPIISGYRKKVDSAAFGDGRNAVYANYDANGKLTGYDSGARVHVSDPQYFQAAWDANGQPKPVTGANTGGGIRGVVQDMMSDPVMGSVMNIVAATLGGPAGVAALAAVQGVPPEEILKRAAIAYVGSEVGGGTTNATASTLGEFGSQAAGQFAGNAASGILSGQGLDVNNLLVNSLLNAGIDVGGNKLLGKDGIATLGAAAPYAKGLGSAVLANAITGKDTDLLKTVTSLATKEAMKSGKEQLKTAKAP